MFDVILDNGVLPNEWCMAIFCPICKKKGEEEVFSNYCGIALLN